MGTGIQEGRNGHISYKQKENIHQIINMFES